MAAIIRPLARRFPISSRRLLASPTQIHHLQNAPTTAATTSFFSRTYISEMRKSAFEGNILRLLRNEIRYEVDRSPPTQPAAEFREFTVDDRPGEQWITMTRKFGEKEDIKIEATMFDGSVPVSNNNAGIVEETLLHITFVVNISKGNDGDVFEILCSAWPDTIEIDRFFIRPREKMPAQPYMGPKFKELEDELQDSLYEFLEERGIDDDLAVFLHQYMKNKDKTEYIRWMETMKTFVEKKQKSNTPII